MSTEQLVADEPTLAGLEEDVYMPWIEAFGEIFNCVACGWWCESSEMADPDGGDGPICAECKDDQ